MKAPFTIIKQILDFKFGENVNSVDHVLPCLNVLFSDTELPISYKKASRSSEEGQSVNFV